MSKVILKVKTGVLQVRWPNFPIAATEYERTKRWVLNACFKTMGFKHSRLGFTRKKMAFW